MGVKTCCFIGHRNTKETPSLRARLELVLRDLIEKKGVQFFLFGSRSRFDELCLKVVTEFQQEYPQIKRIYMRSQAPEIPKVYEEYLLQFYDGTVFPEKIDGAGRAAYVERNQELINASDYCVFYYDPYYQPPKRKYSKRSVGEYQPKSGTQLAIDYAYQKKRGGKEITIVNLNEEETQD